MIKRLFKLKEFIDTSNAELAVLILTSPEAMRLSTAMEGLTECELVSKKLQLEDGLIMWDARILFSSLMQLHPEMGSYIAPQFPIVKYPLFEEPASK
ncbi:uncharacterized protein IUM83_05634 [Phytophthora cinnamomi]|uniref:uncharacterized protein n=1 Tax=Phytophthora cinnamomi TaxID=4785 RepID=UPI00355A529D|nr:hypothetical protein IUM83_05634 [Phytophthora cinnamomi]